MIANRWGVGLATFFAVVLGMNVVLVVLAVRGAEPVVPSYKVERR